MKVIDNSNRDRDVPEVLIEHSISIQFPLPRLFSILSKLTLSDYVFIQKFSEKIFKIFE